MGGYAETAEEVRIVLVTAPDEETARRLAHALVAERLAACVNVVPGVRSVYRWEGAVQEDSEVLLIAKSHEARAAALSERVQALHPYDVPEVLALPAAGGSASYLAWLGEAVAS